MERGTLAIDGNGRSPQVMRPGVTYKITDGNQSIEFTDNVVIRVVSETDVHLKLGANPTATDSDVYLAGGVAEYFKVNIGDKVSVLGGNLYITIME